MAPATFDVWLKTVFDHHPAAGQPEGYWAPDFGSILDPLGIEGRASAQYSRVQRLPPGVLSLRPLSPVAECLWFLCGGSPVQPSHAIIDPSVPKAARVPCVAAISTFFRAFVGPSAPGPARADDDPFHTACYMWWDIFP